MFANLKISKLKRVLIKLCHWLSVTIPPFVPKTKGVKVPSLHLILFVVINFRFFSCSCSLKMAKGAPVPVAKWVTVRHSCIKKCRDSPCPESSRLDVKPCIRTHVRSTCSLSSGISCGSRTPSCLQTKKLPFLQDKARFTEMAARSTSTATWEVL